MTFTSYHREHLKEAGCTFEEIEGIATGYKASIDGTLISEKEIRDHLHTLMLEKYAKNPILA